MKTLKNKISPEELQTIREKFSTAATNFKKMLNEFPKYTNDTLKKRIQPNDYISQNKND